MSAKLRSLSIVSVQLGPQKLSVYGVERWPQNRGFLSTILNGEAVGTKVSVHHRQGGTHQRWLVRGVPLYLFSCTTVSVASISRQQHLVGWA